MATRYFNDLHNWLINEEFSSTRQARLHKAYVLWLNLIANPLAFAGFVVVLMLVLIATFAPLLANHDPILQDLTMALKPPSSANWFGTDEFGRDVYSRLVYGARTTLYISILVTVIVRSGINGWGEEEKRWAQAWRYSNHNSAAFDHDIIVVTEHGWCSLWSHDGGHEPAMVAG